MSHIPTELSLGRYSGPFSHSRLEALIGPFRTSPLGTVQKAVDLTDRRIVQDLSFPRDTSGKMEIVFFAPMNCMVHNGQEIQNGAEFAKNGA